LSLEICNQVLNTLASTDITSRTGDMPYHGRSDAIEKRLRFSKVSADLLIELTDILNIDQAVSLVYPWVVFLFSS